MFLGQREDLNCVCLILMWIGRKTACRGFITHPLDGPLLLSVHRKLRIFSGGLHILKTSSLFFRVRYAKRFKWNGHIITNLGFIFTFNISFAIIIEGFSIPFDWIQIENVRNKLWIRYFSILTRIYFCDDTRVRNLYSKFGEKQTRTLW